MFTETIPDTHVCVFIAAALLREREVQVQDLEGRIARTEAALNTAEATVEEREARIAALEGGATLAQTDSQPETGAASLSTAEARPAKEADAADAPRAQLLPRAEDTVEAGNAAIAPGLPDISEKWGPGPQRSAADGQAEQIEQLESYIQQLVRENEGLQQAVLQAQQQAAEGAQQPHAEEVEAMKVDTQASSSCRNGGSLLSHGGKVWAAAEMRQPFWFKIGDLSQDIVYPCLQGSTLKPNWSPRTSVPNMI